MLNFNLKNRSNLVIVYKYWLPVAVWALIIFLFSSLPTKPVSEIHWKDFIIKKSAHVVEYAVFTFLLFRAFKRYRMVDRRAITFSMLISVFYAATDEIHQSFTPGREPKIRDVLFDTLGTVLSAYIILKHQLRIRETYRAILSKLSL